ncbi:hypothetical protein DFH27DRAFT_521469 [Peziza echinospora]|nr:hypothetical protein DFH27DRAFT_521469 [Peziza echinospora]
MPSSSPPVADSGTPPTAETAPPTPPGIQEGVPATHLQVASHAQPSNPSDGQGGLPSDIEANSDYSINPAGVLYGSPLSNSSKNTSDISSYHGPTMIPPFPDVQRGQDSLGPQAEAETSGTVQATEQSDPASVLVPAGDSDDSEYGLFNSGSESDGENEDAQNVQRSPEIHPRVRNLGIVLWIEDCKPEEDNSGLAYVEIDESVAITHILQVPEPGLVREPERRELTVENLREQNNRVRARAGQPSLRSIKIPEFKVQVTCDECAYTTLKTLDGAYMAEEVSHIVRVCRNRHEALADEERYLSKYNQLLEQELLQQGTSAQELAKMKRLARLYPDECDLEKGTRALKQRRSIDSDDAEAFRTQFFSGLRTEEQNQAIVASGEERLKKDLREWPSVSMKNSRTRRTERRKLRALYDVLDRVRAHLSGGSLRFGDFEEEDIDSIVIRDPTAARQAQQPEPHAEEPEVDPSDQDEVVNVEDDNYGNEDGNEDVNAGGTFRGDVDGNDAIHTEDTDEEYERRRPKGKLPVLGHFIVEFYEDDETGDRKEGGGERGSYFLAMRQSSLVPKETRGRTLRLKVPLFCVLLMISKQLFAENVLATGRASSNKDLEIGGRDVPEELGTGPRDYLNRLECAVTREVSLGTEVTHLLPFILLSLVPSPS